MFGMASRPSGCPSNDASSFPTGATSMYDLRLHYFEPDGLNHRNYLVYTCNLIKE